MSGAIDALANTVREALEPLLGGQTPPFPRMTAEEALAALDAGGRRVTRPALDVLREFTRCPYVDAVDAPNHSGCSWCAKREEAGVDAALAAMGAFVQTAATFADLVGDDTAAEANRLLALSAERLLIPAESESLKRAEAFISFDAALARVEGETT